MVTHRKPKRVYKIGKKNRNSYCTKCKQYGRSGEWFQEEFGITKHRYNCPKEA